VTQLEDRLRADMKAESEQIEPGSIPALRLPARAHPTGRLRHSGPRHWPAWVTALAAAAAVTAVIGGTFLIAHTVSRSGPNPSATGGPPPYSGIPPYYAYAVQGSIYSRTVHGTQYGDSVIARYVKIRATGSGKVLRTVSPPAPYNAFESFTGAANARTFVFAAQWYIHGKLGVPRLYKQDQKTPLKFMILRITPGGQTQLSPLSLPGTLTEAQAPTLALSPDGARLAVAYGGSGKPAVVQVITLATGQMRRWTSPPPAATPVLGGPGAWTSDGRTLALGQMVVQPGGRIRTAPTQMRLLNTAAPGTNLAAASKLVTLHGAGSFPWPFITPDGTKLIGETGGNFRPGATTESGAWHVLGPYRSAPRGHGTVAAARARPAIQHGPSDGPLVQSLGQPTHRGDATRKPQRGRHPHRRQVHATRARGAGTPADRDQ
jgi:hypothetical protein